MPVQFYNLATLHANNAAAQALQLMGQNSEANARAAQVAEQAQIQKAQHSDQTQVTKQTQNNIVQERGKGARSFQLARKQARKQVEGEKSKPKIPKDPSGKGKVLDIIL